MLRARSAADTQVCYARDLFASVAQALDPAVWWPSPVRHLQSRSSAIRLGEAQAGFRVGDHQPSASSLKQGHGDSRELGLRPEQSRARCKDAGEDIETPAQVSHG